MILRIWLLILNGFVAPTPYIFLFSFAIFLGTVTIARPWFLYVVKQKCTTANVVICSDISLFYYQKFFC